MWKVWQGIIKAFAEEYTSLIIISHFNEQHGEGNNSGRGEGSEFPGKYKSLMFIGSLQQDIKRFI